MNIGIKRWVYFGVFLLMATSAFAFEAAFYVSPRGNDSWSGREAEPDEAGKDGPFASLARAISASRMEGAADSRKIIIGEGRYDLREPVEILPEDSGLSISAAPGARPFLCGGGKVTNWTPAGGGLWAARLEGVQEGDWDFRALIVNGRFCSRARMPESGAFTHDSVFDVPWMSSTGGGWKRKPTDQELTTMRFRKGDIPSDLAVSNAEVTVYHMWDESMVGLESIDLDQGIMHFSSPLGHPAGAFGVKKYVVWNTKEGMTRPGQWYLDRVNGRVVYWPLPDENPETMDVIAPRFESVVKLSGKEGRTVRSVRITGLGLEATTTPLRAGGFGAGRFAGALEAAGIEDCVFEDLEIRNVGGQGINIRGGGARILYCSVYQTGACGVRAASCEVTDNLIHDVGLTYPSAIGLVGGGRKGIFSHNEIHHTPYTAINCGGEDHRIEGNLIYQAMLELHDGGGIYCFAGKNIVLRGNYIRDIPDTGGYGSSAYYLDERSEGCLVEGNLSVNIQRPSHNHMAHGNTIRGNVFVSDGPVRLTFPRSDGFRFERNLIVAGGDIRFTNISGVMEMSGNAFCLESGDVIGVEMTDYSETGSRPLSDGYVRGAPEDVKIRDGKVELKPGSDIARAGITGLDVSDAGPRKRRR